MVAIDTAHGADDALGPSGVSKLTAQIRAARAFGEIADRERVALGIVGFSRDRPGGEKGTAWTEAVLSNDPTVFIEGLTRMEERGVFGRRHLRDALDQALIELRGLQYAQSHVQRTGNQRIVILIAGPPTLPYPDDVYGNLQKLAGAGDRARRARVRVDVIGLNLEHQQTIETVRGICAATGGKYDNARDAPELERLMLELLK